MADLENVSSVFGSQVVVRNTFLDLAETPKIQPLSRSVTEPGRDKPVGFTFSDSEGDDEHDEPTEVSTPEHTPKIIQVETCEDPNYWAAVMCEDPTPQLPFYTGMQPGTMMAIPINPGMMPGYGSCQPIQPICVGMGLSQNLPPGCILVPIYPSSAPVVLPSTGSPPGTGSGGYGLPVASIQTPIEQTSDKPFAPSPSPLQRSISVNSGINRIHWSVDARKLKSGDRVAVSPAFDISIGGKEVPFKMLLHPKVVNDGKGGSSFRRSKGHGKVEVKCEAMFDPDTDATANYRISVSSGNATETHKMQPSRGPMRHNFATNGVSSLPAGEDVWDFTTSIDEASMTFVVVLEFFREC